MLLVQACEVELWFWVGWSLAVSLLDVFLVAAFEEVIPLIHIFCLCCSVSKVIFLSLWCSGCCCWPKPFFFFLLSFVSFWIHVCLGSCLLTFKYQVRGLCCCNCRMYICRFGSIIYSLSCFKWILSSSAFHELFQTWFDKVYFLSALFSYNNKYLLDFLCMRHGLFRFGRMSI